MDWEWDIVAGPYNATTEGPTWDGRGLLFSVIPKNQILRYDPNTNQATVFRRFTNRTNGLAFAPDGTLYGCQSGSRRIVRLNKDGSTTPMPYLLDGHYHNQPNDLIVDSKGRVWFSDPYEYGQDTPSRGPQPHPVVDHGSVLRLEPERVARARPEPVEGPSPANPWRITRITFDTLNPNGLALSPDERTLYVAETSLKESGIRELRAYPILDNGGASPEALEGSGRGPALGPYKVLHDFGSGDHRGRFRGVDGMTVDVEGNILACAGREGAGPGPMIYVFSPTGRVLATHPVPADRPTNCTFAGPDLTELYVTTIPGHLFHVRHTGHKGAMLH